MGSGNQGQQVVGGASGWAVARYGGHMLVGKCRWPGGTLHAAALGAGPRVEAALGQAGCTPQWPAGELPAGRGSNTSGVGGSRHIHVIEQDSR